MAPFPWYTLKLAFSHFTVVNIWENEQILAYEFFKVYFKIVQECQIDVAGIDPDVPKLKLYATVRELRYN